MKRLTLLWTAFSGITGGSNWFALINSKREYLEEGDEFDILMYLTEIEEPFTIVLEKDYTGV